MFFPPRTCTIRPNGHAGVGSRTRPSAASGSREGANSPTDSQPKSGQLSAKGTTSPPRNPSRAAGKIVASESGSAKIGALISAQPYMPDQRRGSAAPVAGECVVADDLKPMLTKLLASDDEKKFFFAYGAGHRKDGKGDGE